MMKTSLLLTVGVTLIGGYQTSAVPVAQYATGVIGFSSEWSSGAWSAAQAIGAPDTFAYGDISSAWAPGPLNGTLEFISLGYSTPVFANGAVIRETWGNGFVYQVDVIDMSDVLHTVWTGTDPSLPGTPVNFYLSFAMTTYLVKGLKIYTDTDHDLGAWEEIDSVQLWGDTEYTGAAPSFPVPETATTAGLVGCALLSLFASRRRS